MFSLRFGAGGATRRLDELRLIDLPGYGYAQVSQARAARLAAADRRLHAHAPRAGAVRHPDRRAPRDRGRGAAALRMAGDARTCPPRSCSRRSTSCRPASAACCASARGRRSGAPPCRGAADGVGRDRRGRRRAVGGDLRGTAGWRPPRRTCGGAPGRLASCWKPPHGRQQAAPGVRRRADAARPIWTRSWRSSGVSFRSPWSAQVFLEEMARDWAHVDVVRDRARRACVAFGNYWLVADEVHLLNLATHPEARRAGHASRLLAHIIEIGRRRELPLRHARGSALERRGAAALPAVRLQAGRRSPELLRRGPGRRDRDAAGSDMSMALPRCWRCRRESRSAAFAGSAWRCPSAAADPAAPRPGAPAPLGAAPGDRRCRCVRSAHGDARAGGRDHVRRLRDAQAGQRLRSRRVRHPQARAGAGDDLRLGPLGREPPRRDDRAGERAADRVRRSLLRPPAHVAICRRRASTRRSIRPRRRWAGTASARWRFARRSATGARG